MQLIDHNKMLYMLGNTPVLNTNQVSNLFSLTCETIGQLLKNRQYDSKD